MATTASIRSQPICARLPWPDTTTTKPLSATFFMGDRLSNDADIPKRYADLPAWLPRRQYRMGRRVCDEPPLHRRQLGQRHEWHRVAKRSPDDTKLFLSDFGACFLQGLHLAMG